MVGYDEKLFAIACAFHVVLEEGAGTMMYVDSAAAAFSPQRIINRGEYCLVSLIKMHQILHYKEVQ
jgi:hypothetical protein